MNSVNYENQILDAIDTMVNSAIQKAGYDKTIKAVIVSLEDATIGKYKVRYQDSEIEAYSNNIDLIYPAGTLVTVLIPGNDFSQTKTILDAVEKGKVEYVTILEEDEQYESTGGNTITASQMFGLCSYKENDVKILFDREAGINDINLDTLSFADYIQNSESIICGAEFKTDLDEIQKVRGNFGVVFEIDFIDNLTGATITKAYKVDVNKMTGNPYEQTTFTRQYAIFKINADNFDAINRIYIFSENFPINDDTKEKNDIYVSTFELSPVNKLSQEELDGYYLELSKKGKSYFDAESTETDVVTLQANLKQKNKTITMDIEYYWFKENSSVDSSSSTYNRFGGEGWECLNKYNIINAENDIRMFLSGDNILEIKKADVPTESLIIKCVAVKDGIGIVSNESKILNYDTSYNLEIISDSGNQFYYDNGNPTLICKVNGLNDNENYTYQWNYIDNNGIYQLLEETTEDNEIYNAAVEDYELLLAQIDTGIAMPAANQNELNRLKTIIDSFDYTQRVEGNTIHKIDLTKILEEITFKCLVKKDDIILGTTSYTIKNTLALEGEYTLNIINGTQVFNYSTSGIAPTSDTLEKPITLLPLSFEIKDNLGNLMSNTVLENCEIYWTVPVEDTMIIANDSNELTLNYTIADKFDSNKLVNNNIQLMVKYKSLILNATTAFTFTKDGEPGTNGTDVICKIVPNISETFNEYPMIVNGNLNFIPATQGKWFKVQLWENGEKIFEGTDSDNSHIITWSILKNTYTKNDGAEIADPANISVTGSTFSYLGYNNAAASIVKAQVDYKGVTYYCTLPVLIATTENNYSIKLVNNSGFRYVMYSSDGKKPQYDNIRPFEINVTQIINGYEEDITNINNSYQPIYQWFIQGKIFNVASNNFIDDLHLTFGDNSNLTGNKRFFIPSEDYDGENVTNAVEVKILTNNLTEIGKILIPIHFYLDRYGLSDLAGWDGNRIALNQESGSILAPQVGAGKKESDNTFSGVLMGTVKERSSDIYERGLFGYYHGQRSIFLDSDTGMSIFGFSGKGQIIIDPTDGTAKLYGGNYKNNNNSGMIIDLTTPEIKFGNGNFSVNQYGYLTAKGGGTIGGWNITKNGSWDVLSAGNIILDSRGFMSGGADADHAWSINTDGKATFNDAFIRGTIEASGGTIGGWKIDIDKIYSSNGLSYMNSNGSAKFGNMTVSTSGGITATDMIADGITATRANINGKITTNDITATNGTIGAFTLNTTGIYSGSGTSQAGIGVYGQKQAFWAGSTDTGNAPFRVGHDGTFVATKATITGSITATSGEFKNVTIKDNCVIEGTFDASKITSGVFDTSRIPTLSANKISAGSITTSNIIFNNTSGGDAIRIYSTGHIEFTNEVGYFVMGPEGGSVSSRYNHPYVSALNMSGLNAAITFWTGTRHNSIGTEKAHMGLAYSDNAVVGFQITPGDRFYIDSHYGQTLQFHAGSYYFAVWKGIIVGVSANQFDTSVYKLYP